MDNFYIEPPTGLLEKILKSIHAQERLLALRRVALFSVFFIGSIIGLFPTFNMLLSDFNQSGFLQFFSLVFSDFSTIVTYWKSFIIILLETLPAISLALFLTVVLTFLQSIKSLTHEYKQYFRIKTI